MLHNWKHVADGLSLLPAPHCSRHCQHALPAQHCTHMYGPCWCCPPGLCRCSGWTRLCAHRCLTRLRYACMRQQRVWAALAPGHRAQTPPPSSSFGSLGMQSALAVGACGQLQHTHSASVVQHHHNPKQPEHHAARHIRADRAQNLQLSLVPLPPHQWLRLPLLPCSAVT